MWKYVIIILICTNLTGDFSDLVIWVILMKSYLAVVDVHVSTH